MADVGRPTKYDPKYIEQVYKLCLLGATDSDMANFFNISEATLNNWKIEYPDFLESIKNGKERADATVAESLYKRANGYEHEDIDIKMYEGQIIKTKLIKHYPPDTTAGIFWLKNRRPKEWRDKQEVEHSGSMEVTGFTVKVKKPADES